MGSGAEKNLGDQLVWYVTNGKHGHDYGIGRDGKVAGNTANQKQLLAACELWGSDDPTRMLRYFKSEERGFMFTEPFSQTYWGIWAFAKAAAWVWADRKAHPYPLSGFKAGQINLDAQKWFKTSRALAALHLVCDPNKIRPVSPAKDGSDPYRHVVFAMPGARCKRVASNAWRSLHSRTLKPSFFKWSNADARAYMTLDKLTPGLGIPSWLTDLPTDQEAIDYLQKTLVIFGNWPLFGPVSLHWERYADGGFCSWMPEVPTYDTGQMAVKYHKGKLEIMRPSWFRAEPQDVVILRDSDKKIGIFNSSASVVEDGDTIRCLARYHGSEYKKGSPEYHAGGKGFHSENLVITRQKFATLTATFSPDNPTLSKPEPLYPEMPHSGEPVEIEPDEMADNEYTRGYRAALREIAEWAMERGG